MLLATDAIVLHSMEYLESSRILRMLTREAGVQAVIAKGARRPRSRFGAALDLFAQGSAEILLKPGRDLQTLTGFDVARGRSGLAEDLARFTGAAAIADVVLRFAHDDAGPELFAIVAEALDGIAAAPQGSARERTIGGVWRIVGALGFSPSLDACSICHASVEVGDAVLFHHRAGGILCARCARAHGGGRAIPREALDALRGWLAGEAGPALPSREGRAHQRLLHEFVREHLADGRALRAFDSWASDPADA
ncbi:MAG: DNA repair protein RecO [Gemmatimonadaceae bacterium]|nr:DNA repair protein RecO [Gemmatimonadaceae bacterium]